MMLHPETTESSFYSQPSHHSTASDPDSRYADVEGVIIHHKYLPSIDPVSTPTAICLHGFGASLFSYELCKPLRNYLSLVPYDAPGFGLTSRPSRLFYYTPRFSARVTNVLASAYAQPQRSSHVLIAHSMGAIAATCAAFAQPRRVKAIILIAPALLPLTEGPSAWRRFVQFFGNGVAALSVAIVTLLTPLFIFLIRILVTPEKFWRTALRMARSPTSLVSDDVVNGYRRPMHVPDWEKGLLNFTRASLKDRATALRQDQDYVSMLARLGPAMPPVMVVHGSHDSVVPVANSHRLVEKWPNAKLVVMDDCGHVPHEEAPHRFTEIVVTFLNENT